MTNVQPEDKGTYVCRAENGPGQATFKTSMIDVFEAPTIVQNEETKYLISAKRGENVELKCPLRSRPRADVQWYFQGRLLTSNHNQRVSTIGDKSILTIRNFQPAISNGIYQCFAQNEYGSNQFNIILFESNAKVDQIVPANLQDIPKKPVIIMGPQNTTVYEGQSVVLLCITSETSSGNTQINWLQNDLIIEPTLMRRFEINQLLGNLRIVSIQKSDTGIYKCIASNEFGMSTAEAYVQVKSSSVNNQKVSSNNDEDLSKEIIQNKENKKAEPKKQHSTPTASRPIIQQIGVDKILLKWQLVDGNANNIVDTSSIAYFKVDYKTNKQQQIPGIQPGMWLTIDEQIDPKKREYILTDLSKHEIYRFRITTFFQNGDLNHSHHSSKFKLEPLWSNSNPQTISSEITKSNDIIADLKLAQIQVQITQIWAISSSSLGLKWNVFLPNKPNSTNLIVDKINGFYIYYRKIATQSASDPSSGLIDASLLPSVPLYNYTRINLPLVTNEPAQPKSSHQLIETQMIANLEPSSQYEIKMTCYNINGDLCSFSNTVTGLTLSPTSSTSSVVNLNPNNKVSSTNQNSTMPKQNADATNVVYIKSKQNEILFMILGVVLGVLTLLLLIFVIMCFIRNRQHKRLLAQLQNTSQKLTSSSCPTLIYEDSLRQNNQNRLNTHHANLNLHQSNYANKLLDTNLFINNNNLNGANSNNDSNSTNSQSMSTTTSSMTTPPALVSAQSNSDNLASSGITPSHILLLNGNTVSAASLALSGMPPPIPQVPPPSIYNGIPNATGTLNRINISLNPLNGYLEANTNRHPNSALSPVKNYLNAPQNNQENFYHTLTALGNLPPNVASLDLNEASAYAEYNNATLNMRAQLLLKQQQQQQQMLMNTLKNINLKHQQQLNQIQTNQFSCNVPQSSTSTLDKSKRDSNKSPSSSSMRRNNSVTSSKKSKKGSKNNNQANNDNSNNTQQQQQPKNYYLLPNIRTGQGIITPNSLMSHNIYNGKN